MRILVIEDNSAMSEGLRAGLSAEGFEVDVEAEGPAGLRAALQRHYDVVILDIMLPGMNGYDVCRGIRSAGSAVPVMMLTTKDGEYDEADGLDVGADDYLRKPFAFVVLLARLHALIRRSGPAPASSVLSVGSVVIDPIAHEVRVGGTVLELTPREHTLLETLMRHPGQTLQRTQLARLVWGEEVESNVVDVYIGYLRRKLDRAGADVDLDTVRGLGYRLRTSASGGTR